MLSIMASGFVLGFSLILAIGAQNAFVLRAGLMRRHVLPLVLVCAISDAMLIAAGVAGFGALVQSYPAIVDYLRYCGAAFLLVYGLRAFLSAKRGGSAMECGEDENDLWISIVICLMLTWLNPHVYLDTVVLVGSLAAQSADPWVFGTGAISASFVFFFSLGYGARFLSSVFQNPRAWQILDFVIALVMWSIAYGLLFRM
jgi:L-lysine exporter family protein LysE/ArgO